MKAFGRANVLWFAILAACTASPQGEEEPFEATTQTPAPIIGAGSGSAYAEAVLVDMSRAGRIVSACSGALIAPKVVLTAGHCVDGFDGWRVRAPFANNQVASSSQAATYDWSGNSATATVNPNQHDVALVFLNTPITLASYPTIARAKVAEGAQLINVGRISDGTFSNTALFAGQPVAVRDATRYGYPFDYISSEIIQSGDSGGPCEVPGATPHQIAAVNSGSGGGTQVLARVDLLADWIQQQVAAHGGGGSAGGGSTGGGSTGGTATCAAPEKEPNDTYTSPNTLGAQSCGALSGADQDWFTWSAAAAGVAYDVRLTATGDAELQMWKQASGSWRKLTNTSPTEIAGTASAAGTYVLVVYSPSGAAQTYKLAK